VIFEQIRTYLFSTELLENCRKQEKDFTRNRSLTFVNLAVFIINFVKKSLQLELYNFADFFSLPSVTKQAFSKARNKLSPVVFTLLNQKLLEEFYSDNTIRTFKTLRLLAIDGSTLRLPHAAELYETYGSDTTNNSGPLAKVSVMFDVLNHVALHGTIGNIYASEREMALEHIEQLSQKNYNNESFEDLLIFDRGYPSLGLLFVLHGQKKHFLIRIQDSFLAEINDAIKSGSNDSIVTILAFTKSRRPNARLEKYLPNLQRDAALQLRVLVFDLGNGKKEYIITSLIDQKLFSYDDIFTIYGLRWNVEEGYKFYKNITEMENFSGKSKIAIEQDFHATIFAGNISALLMLEAQDEIEEIQSKKILKYKYKINRNILVGTIKNEIMDVLMGEQDLNEYCENLKTRIKKNLVPIRPGRKFPRIFKRVRSTIDRRAL
jgi:hypothetical protein